ncbi:hypothetical protein CWB75_08000 [Pseudoalteromonas sp. S1608]|nr:hypothetical protein CWB75_08000 [Pseudoalteromonas sp. S1608]
MSITIFFITKVFDKQEYAEDVIKVKLFSNRLSVYDINAQLEVKLPRDKMYNNRDYSDKNSAAFQL